MQDNNSKKKNRINFLLRSPSTVFVLLFLGIILSFFLRNSISEREKIDQIQLLQTQASQLANSFSFLLKNSNGPLQSLATLFNGSGRVAADEFEKTIEYLESHNIGSFPSSMGFLSKSQPSSCGSDEGCWMVAYSTDTTGVLRPGSDVSRFGPLQKTIDIALENENKLIIGPVFQGESAKRYSYYALTIRNTRQFGVVVSLIDYEGIVSEMYRTVIPEGTEINIEALEKNSFGELDFNKVVHNVIFSNDKGNNIMLPVKVSNLDFNVEIISNSEYLRKPFISEPNYALISGVLITLLVVVLLARLPKRF